MANKELDINSPDQVLENGYSNPYTLLADFRQDTLYQEALDQFFAGKVIADTVSDERRSEVFEESELAKQALIDFTGTSGLALDPDLYTEETRTKIQDYIEHVRFTRQQISEGATQDDLAELDFQRSSKHLALANDLVDNGIAPNTLIGRTIGRLMLIHEGLDTVEEAKKPYIEALRRVKA